MELDKRIALLTGAQDTAIEDGNPELILTLSEIEELATKGLEHLPKLFQFFIWGHVDQTLGVKRENPHAELKPPN